MTTEICLVRFGSSNGSFVRTKLVINHLPNHFIMLHSEIGVGDSGERDNKGSSGGSRTDAMASSRVLAAENIDTKSNGSE